MVLFWLFFGFFSESDKTQQQCMLPCQPSLLMRINKSTICGLTVSNWSENTVNVESLQPNKYLYVNLGSSSHVFVIRITCKQKGRWSPGGRITEVWGGVKKLDLLKLSEFKETVVSISQVWKGRKQETISVYRYASFNLIRFIFISLKFNLDPELSSVSKPLN